MRRGRTFPAIFILFAGDASGCEDCLICLHCSKQAGGMARLWELPGVFCRLPIDFLKIRSNIVSAELSRTCVKHATRIKGSMVLPQQFHTTATMKTARFVLILLLFCSSPILAGARQTTPQQNQFPDLLDDDAATDESADTAPELTIHDPLEPMNRFFFKVNDNLYEWVLKPVTNVYSTVMPEELRGCLNNFFSNLSSPVTLVNSLLQGNFRLTGKVISRFVINSTIGVYGMVDVASQEFHMDPERADFGQTLGKWGLGEGVFLYWPFFGPSSVRDTAGLVTDSYLHPVPYITDSWAIDMGYYATNKVNSLSLYPDIYEDVKRYSLDPYVASRQAWYEYRKAMIER
jgi:phospholipid-binding lipoprotein MlaA